MTRAYFGILVAFGLSGPLLAQQPEIMIRRAFPTARWLCSPILRSPDRR